MKKRAKFHIHGSNKLKTYRRKYSDFQVRVRAEIARQARLRDRQMAELAFEEILKTLEVAYEIEKIFLNGDRWVLIDFFIPDKSLAIEVDGEFHRQQIEYDKGRELFLLTTGVRTIRFANTRVMNSPHEVTSCLKKELDLEDQVL